MLVDKTLVEHLDRHGVAFCLIGGVALAAWGVGRFTADVDLLTLDARVLQKSFWSEGGLPEPLIRQGDSEDPLGGVIRLAIAPPHDLILGRSRGAAVAMERRVRPAGFPCAVADPLGLVLLKLEAGSPQDAYDVLSLLKAAEALGLPDLKREVEAHLGSLDLEARRTWAKLQSF